MKRTTHMGMITQGEDNRQDTLEKILRYHPVISVLGEKTYIIVKELTPEFDQYIHIGRTEAKTAGVFTDAQERELTAYWLSNGYNVSFHNQPFKYMHDCISIRYPTVNNPRTGMSVTLIPWCMYPGKPYPVFVYAYAAWHYTITGQRSMRLSAQATGRVFGIESFHKSSLCRLLKDKGFTSILMGDPQMGGGRPEHQNIDAPAYVYELLERPAPIQSINEPGNEGQCPQQTSGIDLPINILSTAPIELSYVIKGSPPVQSKIRDTRKRSRRPRHKEGIKKVQRSTARFVESSQIDQIRKAFIKLCKAAVMDAAIKYHKFLI